MPGEPVPKTIPLTRGKVAVVSDEDYDRVRGFTWHARPSKNTFYAVCRHVPGPSGRRSVQMHRLIAGAGPGEIVDHHDGDGLNNRRSNLRVCQQQHNIRNAAMHSRSRAGYKGVTPRGRRWGAQISVGANGPRHGHLWLGVFDSAEAAARAYDDAARKYFGEFACVNFPRPGERGARPVSTT